MENPISVFHFLSFLPSSALVSATLCFGFRQSLLWFLPNSALVFAKHQFLFPTVPFSFFRSSASVSIKPYFYYPMKKILYTLFIYISFTASAMAQNVTIETARHKADDVLRKHFHQSAKAKALAKGGDAVAPLPLVCRKDSDGVACLKAAL